MRYQKGFHRIFTVKAEGRIQMGKQQNKISAYQGNQPYIFVDYSQINAEKAMPLIEEMQNRGYRVRFAQKNEENEKIKSHIHDCRIFVALTTKYAATSDKSFCDRISEARKSNKYALIVYLEDGVTFPSKTEAEITGFRKLYYTRLGSDASVVDQMQNTTQFSVCRERGKENAPIGTPVKISGHFRITPENEELFRQAELLYAQWLFDKDETVTLDVVNRAIELCRRSAEMDNPKALVRLAYFYDKNYYLSDGGDELSRFKRAYTCYGAVCFSKLEEIPIYEGCRPFSWDQLRRDTAGAMLRMLSHAPEDLKDEGEYSYQNNLERVRMELGEIE